MSVNLQQLNSNKLGGFSLRPKPFWLPLLAMLLLSVSFMEFSITGANKLAGASDMGEIKFSMHIVAYLIMGFLFLKCYKGRIPKSSDLKLYVTYCLLVIMAVFVYAFRSDDINAVMVARALDLALFTFVILVFLRMKIEDSYFITLIAVSAPIFAILFIYLFSPDQAFSHFSSQSGYLPRLGGKNSHPNLLGACAAISLIMILGARIKNIPKLFLSLILFLVIILSQSRTPLLALLLSIIGSFMLARDSFSIKVIIGGALTLLIMATVLAYQAGLGDIVSNRPMNNVSTLGGRTLLWGVALKEFFNGSVFDFLFGINPFFATKKFIVSHDWQPSTLHNTYLHVLLGCGVFAAFIYTLMLVRLLRVRTSRRELTFSLRAIAIYLLVAGLTEQTAAVKLDYFTILLPLLIAQCYQQKNIENSKSKASQNI